LEYIHVVTVDVCRHPSAGSVSNAVKVRFTPPKDIPVDLYIKVFVGYKNRYCTLSVSLILCSLCMATVLSGSARNWHVESLYLSDGHGRLASASRARPLVLRVPSICRC